MSLLVAAAVLPAASPINTEPVCRISVLVPLPVKFTDSVPPRDRTGVAHRAGALDTVYSAADRRAGAIGDVERRPRIGEICQIAGP